jgi:hypothetical protein
VLQKLSVPLLLYIAVITRKCLVQLSERSSCAGGLFGVLWEVKFDIKMLGKKLAASSMLHEAKVAYYAFDVAARFLILLFMPLLWLR